MMPETDEYIWCEGSWRGGELCQRMALLAHLPIMSRLAPVTVEALAKDKIKELTEQEATNLEHNCTSG